MALNNARGYLKDIKAKVNGLADNKDALNKKYIKMKEEKEDMYNKFENVIADLRKKANYKNHILE